MSKLSRRNFLKYVSAGTCGAAIHNAMRPANQFMAFAAPHIAGALGSNPIMLVVNFAGGISHNWSPIYDGWYMDANPNIAYSAANSIPLTSSQGLHPSLTYLKTLWDEGSCAVVNLVGMGNNGIPSYTRAHDLDTARKLTGLLSDTNAMGGWPPRLTAQMSSSLGGVALSGESLVVQGESNPPKSVANLSNLGEDNLFWGDLGNWFRETRSNLILDSTATDTTKLNAVKGSILNVEALAKILAQQANIALPITFPNTGLGRNMQDIARLVNANLGTQFFFAEIGGNDTHSNERNSMPGTLTQFNDAISALVRCAKQQGWYNRLVILTLSEFGRTVYENGNQGNDHGHSNAMFIMGGGVSGGRLIGPTPTQADTVGRSYFHNYHTDFRQVFYEAVAAMGYNADLVFPQRISFTPTGLFV